MKNTIISTLLLTAVGANAATSTLPFASGFDAATATNARPTTTTPDGRLYVAKALVTYGGMYYVAVASTLDGAAWTTSTSIPPNLTTADRDPSIAAVGNKIVVVYTSGSNIVYRWCTPASGYCTTWSAATTLGAGKTASAVAVNGVVYVAWDDNGSIKATNFVPGGSVAPVQSVIQGSGAVAHRLPAIVGRWNSTTNWAEVSVFHYSQIPGSWYFLRTDWTAASGWITMASLMSRSTSSTATLRSVSASMNTATGAVMAALSLSDSNGAGAWLFNGTTSMQLLTTRARITLDSVQGCAATAVRMAMWPDGGNAAWRETRIQTTLAQAGAPASITVSGIPFASAWSRYVSSMSSAYTDRVDVIYAQPHPWDASDVIKAEYFRVSGFQAVPACQIGGPSWQLIQ